MSASEEASGARRQPSGDEGGTPPKTDSRERAAFHVSIHSSSGADGQTYWETRAYHEESDTAIAWPGAPGEALIRWLITVAELPRGSDTPEPPGEATPEPRADEPAPEPKAEAAATEAAPAEPLAAPDDFTQIIGISAATAQRLHEAGITTYAQLAASSAPALGAILDLPPERISRRGWITRARALARLASLPTSTARPAPMADPAPETAVPAGTALHVEVLFDEHGAILEQRLLREGEAPTPDRRWEGGYTARIFIEPAAALGDMAAVAPLGGTSEVEFALDDLELEELPDQAGKGGPQLQARSTLRLVGLGAEHLLDGQPTYLAYVLAHELETGATAVLQGVAGQLRPSAHEQPLELACALPEIGRYQILLVAVVADCAALSVVAGPRLRVTP